MPAKDLPHKGLLERSMTNDGTQTIVLHPSAYHHRVPHLVGKSRRSKPPLRNPVKALVATTTGVSDVANRELEPPARPEPSSRRARTAVAVDDRECLAIDVAGIIRSPRVIERVANARQRPLLEGISADRWLIFDPHRPAPFTSLGWAL